jgi:hypothetical protein
MLVRRLDSNGEPCYGHGFSDFLAGADAVVTLVLLAIRTTLGEWFLDADLGVAWWMQEEGQRQILGQRPADLAFARSEFIRVVTSVQGVSAVEDLVLDINHATRELSASITVLTDYGAPRTIQMRTAL